MKKSILLLTLLVFTPNGISRAGAAEPKFVKPYLEIQTLLARDTIEGLAAPAAALESALKADQQKNALKPAQDLRSAKTLADAREKFLSLSKAILPWARKHKLKGVILAYCPMKPGHWLQKEGELRNPYYGAEMLECGVVQETGKK
ncbi:MAG: DUF3347 domain-containing protein [Proteobacteria bacterium]|nr:DUF3347 domain-containing protein [Pseudomonadota bacterium]